METNKIKQAIQAFLIARGMHPEVAEIIADLQRDVLTLQIVLAAAGDLLKKASPATDADPQQAEPTVPNSSEKDLQ